MKWTVCQLGAREHYSIPRSLFQNNSLNRLITDFWIPRKSPLSILPGSRRLKERWHEELPDSKVSAFNSPMLAFELRQRMFSKPGWQTTMDRNLLFQRCTITELSQIQQENEEPHVLFSYSYAAGMLFQHASSRTWRTVLGQIDPGPKEEDIVKDEHERYPQARSRWKPAPSQYWEFWETEVDLADRIVVNSQWSFNCLIEKGVAAQKIEIIPLHYRLKSDTLPLNEIRKANLGPNSPFKILFLGQITLRKGIGRLLDAMRLLKSEPVELLLVGPLELDLSSWNDLESVHWIDSVPRSHVHLYYRSADIFILPTLSDGFALTQLEALSFGIPILVSRYCGNAAQDGINGLILPDLEPQTIADYITRARIKCMNNEFTSSSDEAYSDISIAERLNSLTFA